MPAIFLLNPSGIFVVNPSVTGYTPTPSEVEWPGSVSSLMTITNGAPAAAVGRRRDGRPGGGAGRGRALDATLDSDGDGLEDMIEVAARHRPV